LGASGAKALKGVVDVAGFLIMSNLEPSELAITNVGGKRCITDQHRDATKSGWERVSEGGIEPKRGIVRSGDPNTIRVELRPFTCRNALSVSSTPLRRHEDGDRLTVVSKWPTKQRSDTFTVAAADEENRRADSSWPRLRPHASDRAIGIGVGFSIGQRGGLEG
jgi:hypothetical protein